MDSKDLDKGKDGQNASKDVSQFLSQTKTKSNLATNKALSTIIEQQKSITSHDLPSKEISASFKSKIASQHDKASAIAAEAGQLRKDADDKVRKAQQREQQAPSSADWQPLSILFGGSKPPTTRTRGTITIMTPNNTQIPQESSNSAQKNENRASGSSSLLSVEGSEASVSTLLSQASHALPIAESSVEKLIPLFKARLAQLEIALIVIVLLIAGMSALLEYVYFVLPKYLASSRLLSSEIFLPTPQSISCIFQCWIPCIVSIFIVVYGMTLKQFPKNIQWGCLGQWRWLIPLLLKFYLIAAFIRYALQTQHVSRLISDKMWKDFKTGKNTLEPLELTQIYHNCCGLRSHKDWSTYARNSTLLKSWHGTLCTNGNDTFFGNKPTTKLVCSVPASCWYQTENKPWRRNVHPVGCVDKEIALVYWVLGIYIGILGVVICGLAGSIGCLYCIIRITEKRHIHLEHRFRFEECMQ